MTWPCSCFGRTLQPPGASEGVSSNCRGSSKHLARTRYLRNPIKRHWDILEQILDNSLDIMIIMILYHNTMILILISQQIFLHSAFPFWRSWGSVCYAFKVMTAAEAKFYRDGLEAQIDLGSSYLPTHLWYITDTVDETKSCMWLCILTTSIVAFSCFFTISTVAEVCASAVWLKGIFVFRDLGISWGYKWRTRFVSFMFRTRWASGHLGVASVQDDWDAGCPDVLRLSDLDR